MEKITFLIAETVGLTFIVLFAWFYKKNRDKTYHNKISIGAYNLVKKIGEGGMAEVHLALHTVNKKQVAVKILLQKFDTDKLSIKRFMKEGKNLKKIKTVYPDSPVVQVHEYGREDTTGRYIIVMEYLPGDSLKHILKSKEGIDFKLKLHIVREVAKALKASHALSIYHRDVSPENIIVNGKKVTLIDFGIAKEMSTDMHTVTGIVLGKLKYISPEQFNGVKASEKSDIYALGVVLFFLVEGRPPYDSGNPYQMINMHQTQPIPEIKAPTPQELKNFLYRMLDKRPEKRPDAGEVIAKIENFLK